MTTHPTEHMDETVEVSYPQLPYFIFHMLIIQFCALVVEQAIVFLDNLSTLDSSPSSLSTKEVFERKSQILPNSAIGRHLRHFHVNTFVDLRHVEGRIAKVLDAIEHPNPETLSYEGGKKMVP
jgi:hypothetical protein